MNGPSDVRGDKSRQQTHRRGRDTTGSSGNSYSKAEDRFYAKPPVELNCLPNGDTTRETDAMTDAPTSLVENSNPAPEFQLGKSNTGYRRGMDHSETSSNYSKIENNFYSTFEENKIHNVEKRSGSRNTSSSCRDSNLTISVDMTYTSSEPSHRNDKEHHKRKERVFYHARQNNRPLIDSSGFDVESKTRNSFDTTDSSAQNRIAAETGLQFNRGESTNGDQRPQKDVENVIRKDSFGNNSEAMEKMTITNDETRVETHHRLGEYDNRRRNDEGRRRNQGSNEARRTYNHSANDHIPFDASRAKRNFRGANRRESDRSYPIDRQATTAHLEKTPDDVGRRSAKTISSACEEHSTSQPATADNRAQKSADGEACISTSTDATSTSKPSTAGHIIRPPPGFALGNSSVPGFRLGVVNLNFETASCEPIAK